MKAGSVNSKEEIDMLFMLNAKYGIAEVKIREFLLCDYKIANPENLEIFRDRDWIANLQSLDSYCFVPTKIRDEIPVIKSYLARKSNFE